MGPLRRTDAKQQFTDILHQALPRQPPRPRSTTATSGSPDPNQPDTPIQGHRHRHTFYCQRCNPTDQDTIPSPHQPTKHAIHTTSQLSRDSRLPHKDTQRQAIRIPPRSSHGTPTPSSKLLINSNETRTEQRQDHLHNVSYSYGSLNNHFDKTSASQLSPSTPPFQLSPSTTRATTSIEHPCPIDGGVSRCSRDCLSGSETDERNRLADGRNRPLSANA